MGTLRHRYRTRHNSNRQKQGKYINTYRSPYSLFNITQAMIEIIVRQRTTGFLTRDIISKLNIPAVKQRRVREVLKIMLNINYIERIGHCRYRLTGKMGFPNKAENKCTQEGYLFWVMAKHACMPGISVSKLRTICREKQLKLRRLYDFLSVLRALDIVECYERSKREFKEESSTLRQRNHYIFNPIVVKEWEARWSSEEEEKKQ